MGVLSRPVSWRAVTTSGEVEKDLLRSAANALLPPRAVRTPGPSRLFRDNVRRLAAAEITTGPIFRPVGKDDRVSAVPLSAFSAAEIVKHYATRAGLDPASFAGHSLCAGFLTSAAEAGASIFRMMDVSRHKSVDTLRGYVRRAEGFKDHAGAAFL